MARYCAILLLSLLALPGCASEPAGGTRVYAASSATMFEAANQKWLASDRPEKNTLVLQSDTFGASKPGETPRQTFEQAAVAFLAQTGRKCRVLSGSEVMAQTYEFAYRCDPAR